MKIEYNSIKPKSSKFELERYRAIRESDPIRDKDYSPIHDACLNAICETLKEFTDKETFDKVWTSSLFPERLTKRFLRLHEEAMNKTL